MNKGRVAATTVTNQFHRTLKPNIQAMHKLDLVVWSISTIHLDPRFAASAASPSLHDANVTTNRSRANLDDTILSITTTKKCL
jgi:hypothetical protein